MTRELILDGGDIQARRNELTHLVEDILASARHHGATAAEVAASDGTGLSVSVRQRELETVEFTRERGFGFTVYVGQRKGSASTTDARPEAIEETVRAACNIARFTAEDEYAGLADAELMARDIPDLDLFHPWALTPAEAERLALECEAAALDADARIVNSEGAQVDSHQGVRVYGNSHGFVGAVTGSRHSLSCVVVGADADGMQRDYWYSSARRAAALESARRIGERAAERTLARLGSRPIATCRVPVAFAAEVASSLIGHLIGAISGGALYRRASFLCDSLGQTLFPQHIRVEEHPRVPGALGSAAFDGEGVATRDKALIDDGVLASYVLGSYSARRLGMTTTGNAGGVHNVYVTDRDADPSDELAAVLRELGTGLLVTEFLGSGINMVTGDYSRGAAGFWIEDGVISHPVEGVTVAGNLRDMFAGVVRIGNDVDTRGNILCGSIIIDGMTVGGT